MSKRILRVNQLIQKELGQIFLREIEFPPGTFVTITRVEVTPDLIEAKVYISSFPESQIPRTLRVLKNQTYHIQKVLNKRLKMKIIPRIKFVEEPKTKEAGEIEAILEKLKKEEK